MQALPVATEKAIERVKMEGGRTADSSIMKPHSSKSAGSRRVSHTQSRGTQGPGDRNSDRRRSNHIEIHLRS